MKTKLFIPLILLAVVIMIPSCKKEKPQPTSSASATLTLTADKTSILLGEEAILTATTNAANPAFTWSVNSSSTIVGSGSQVRLLASCPSCIGANEVTCTVNDASNNSVSQKITITVY